LASSFFSLLPPTQIPREKKAHKFSGRRWSLEIQTLAERMAQVLFCQLFSIKKKVVALNLKIIFRIIFIQKPENKTITESNPFSDLILC
jgi:hypothetical protein